MVLSFFFFFQAEDGIRDRNVTGVQTCALPISPAREEPRRRAEAYFLAGGNTPRHVVVVLPGLAWPDLRRRPSTEIGRASCRERGKIWGWGARVKEEVRGGLVGAASIN